MRLKHLFLMMALLGAFSWQGNAQGFVSFAYVPFQVTQSEVTVYLGNATSKTIGDDFEILGGKESFTFSWKSGTTELGANPLLTVTKAGDYVLTIQDKDKCSATVTYTVKEGSDVGLETVPTPTVKLFPTPTEGLLTIQSDESDFLNSVAIYSATGVLVYSYQTDDADDLSEGITINLSDIPAGIYLVTMYFENKKVTKTIIKK